MKIKAIKQKNGDFKRVNGTEIFKGDKKEYISKFYKKGFSESTGNLIENYWQINNYEIKGLFSHWD